MKRKLKKTPNSVKGSSLLRQGGASLGRGGYKASQVVIQRNPYCEVKLKIGTVNVGSMAKRSGEVAEMAHRRGLDFCCLQETRWKGEQARKIGGEGMWYKFYWKGCEQGVSGVGILVAERWIDKVIEVKRFSERIMLLRVIVGKSVVCLVSVYAPQVGRGQEEKEEFYTLLRQVLSGVSDSERMVVCGDWNGHVGPRSDGFEGVHGGKGFGRRNEEGELLLEFADAMELVVMNTWFQKPESRLVTYESGGCKTVVDYVLVRKRDRTMVWNVGSVPYEACIPQHKLMVCEVRVKEQLKSTRKTIVSKCKVWKLRDGDTGKTFQNKVTDIAASRVKGDVEVEWKGLKDCLMSVAEEVCGKTKGRKKHKETWWWNEDVAKVIAEKRRLFQLWKESGKDNDKDAYCEAKKEAKRVVYKAQEAERHKFSESLHKADEKRKLFKFAKRIVGQNKDVAGGTCVKDKDGKIVVEESRIKEVWRDYFEKISNEEFDWNKDSLEKSSEVSGPAECISLEEVRDAVAAMKVGKAAGPSGVVAEMLKAAGEAGVQWVTDLCNSIVKEGRIPDDWKKSWLLCLYKGKGDALDCGSYRGIKLLDQVMKVFERVIEKRVRGIVKVDGMQFGFRAGKSTTDAIFIVRQIQEKFLAKKKDLWMAFVDLEKAFDRVPRDVLWWALRKKGVDEWLVSVIRSMYAGATTSVKLSEGESAEFEVKVGVHQGSVLSPLLFITVMDALSDEFKEGLPWELLYADDLVLIAETEEALMVKIKTWKDGIEMKGLRVNMGKTKVMRCQVGVGKVDNSGKFPCGVCHKGVGTNSIQCMACRKWIHKKCSNVKGRLKADSSYKCATCLSGGPVKMSVKELTVGTDGKLECVERFCYLGDMISAGGGAEDAARARVRCAWNKFRELSPILTTRGASLRLKGKIYKACVQSVMVYGSETWAMKVDDMQRLERAERMMMRWMCGVSLKDRVRIEDLRQRLCSDSVSDVVRRGRLRWFGHVERKSADDWVSACRNLVVEGVRGRGRGRKTWNECVKDDLGKLGLTREDAQDRFAWRVGVYGKPSNPC